jgi:adenylate cyclase
VARSAETSDDDAFFRAIETHRARTFMRVMRSLPSEPRCAVCRAPFGGIGGRMMRPLGFVPSRKNPRLCASCFEKVPVGGVRMEVGVLFADVRGFTSMAEHEDPSDTAALLNRFYGVAVDVLCHHAIIDKLVGDEVMALYLPQLLGEDAAQHMVADSSDLLRAAPAELELGVGLDYGTAFVGNVGAGDVKDFTAIGHVVNTASRLQAAAQSGEIVISSRVRDLVGGEIAGAATRRLTLKGKSEPEEALVLKVSG